MTGISYYEAEYLNDDMKSTAYPRWTGRNMKYIKWMIALAYLAEGNYAVEIKFLIRHV